MSDSIKTPEGNTYKTAEAHNAQLTGSTYVVPKSASPGMTRVDKPFTRKELRVRESGEAMYKLLQSVMDDDATRELYSIEWQMIVGYIEGK